MMQINKILNIREPKAEDENNFLSAMQRSQSLHHSWVKPPLTSEEFKTYLKRSHMQNQKNYFVCELDNIVGVFNINEIVRGFFESAYLYLKIDGQWRDHERWAITYEGQVDYI